MTTTIEIWRSSSGISDEDFSLLTTVADGAPFSALDTPVTPGQLYIYKARRVNTITAEISGFSPLVYMIGPVPIGSNALLQNTTVNAGIVGVCGVGIEPGPGQAVVAGRKLELVSCGIKGGPKRIASKAKHNHPGKVRTVLGDSDYAGPLVVEITPESIDELLAMTFGPPTTTAVAAPATPGQPAGAIVGTPGGVTASYTIVAANAQGDSAASTARSLTTVPGTLNGTNYVHLTISPVAGATYYKVLKGGQLLGITNTLTFDDQGQATTAYVAPSDPTGNMHVYNAGLSKLTGTLPLQYGTGLIRIYAGVSVNKFSIKFDHDATEPLTLSLDVVALYEIDGYTLSQVGLDTAGYDTLNGYGVAPACVAQIGNAQADAPTFDLEVDRNLGLKKALNGSMGGVTHFLQEGNHKLTSTLYFTDHAEKARFFGQASAATPFGHSKTINFYPVALTVSNPVNGGGVVNQFIVFAPYCTYDTFGDEIPADGGAIMQQVEITPYIDPVTGTDIQIIQVNSRTRSNIITPSTLITPVPTNGVNSYTN